MTSSHLAPPTVEVGEGGPRPEAPPTPPTWLTCRVTRLPSIHTQKKQKTKSKTFTANRKEKLFLI